MVLLERGPILNELHRLLSQASSGHGSLALVGGEAGVGKTTLLRYFIDEARSQASVLLGLCDALSTPRALGPLFDIAATDSDLHRLLSENAPRDRVFRAILARLSTGTRPVVLAIEDAHWADEATLDLIRYLGRRIETTRGLVIVTYRNDEIGPRHTLRGVLGDLAAVVSVERLDVPPLTKHGVATLADGSDVDPEELYARTGGNPFFVTAVLAAGGEIPPTVRDAVLARAARLSPSAWTVLEAAAVIGTVIDPGLLFQVAGPAIEDLGACLESGILEEHGATLSFRHELAREAVLGAISPAKRRVLHARVLHDLEATLDGALHPARLAHHAEEASDRAAVLRHAPEAARRASRLKSHRAAAEQYARALRFADTTPTRQRAELLEGLAYECYLTAQIDRAIAARQAALEDWHALGDQRKEGESRCHLAILHWAEARVDDANREAVAAVSLLETIPPGPDLALAYATLGRLRGPTASAAEGIAWGERAIALAEQFQATEVLIDALIDVGATRLAEGDDGGLAQVERGLALALEAGLDELAARAYHNLGFGFGEQFQFARAAPWFVEGIAFCADRDLDHPRLFMAAWLAYCRLFLGDWGEAADLAEAVLRASDVSPNARFIALLVAAVVRVRRGLPASEQLLDEALTLAQTSKSPYFLAPIHAARAEAAWLAGDRARCVAEARATYDLALTHRQPWYCGELAYWLWKGGELAAPPAVIAEPFARQIAGDSHGAAAAWDTLECPYEAAWARAEAASEDALRSALATFERLGAQPAAALARGRLRELGARGVPRGPRPATRANPAGLTPREVEVLALLAEGRSNQEIGDRLFLSPRTIEHHVSSILAKLGVATRAEAGLAAIRLGIGRNHE